jgi:hypothetical protein
MIDFLPLWLGLFIFPACQPIAPATLRASDQQSPLRAYADLDHNGRLTVSVTASTKAADTFGIAVPLPTRVAEQSRLPEKSRSGEELSNRLGRLRVETAKTARELLVSIDSGTPRSLRVYCKTAGVWQRVAQNPQQEWAIAAGEDGALELGVGVVIPDARRGGPRVAWPRAFTVQIAARSNPREPIRIPFRVAPYIVPSALDPVERLLMVSQDLTSDSVEAVRDFAAQTATRLTALDVPEDSDQWMQDTIEPGLFTFPTGDRPQQVFAILSGLRDGSGAQSARLDQYVTRRLRGQGVLTVSPGVPRKQARWIDWYGNLEATPPHTDGRSREFPYGRIITGKQGELTMHPDVMRFLEAQAVQWPPVVVDTSWLLIGHVDETVNFVPAKGKPGFKVLLPSPRAAREMIEQLLAQGLGRATVFAGTDDETTLARLSMTVAGTTENSAIDEAVSRVRQQLKKELNLQDSDFVMLPALFDGGVAVIPNAVNSAVVNRYLLVPEPRGPLVGGVDAFEQAIRKSLERCDVRVFFIDAWDAYHMAGGELHCGTNAFRRLRDPEWWNHEQATSRLSATK